MVSHARTKMSDSDKASQGTNIWIHRKVGIMIVISYSLLTFIFSKIAVRDSWLKLTLRQNNVIIDKNFSKFQGSQVEFMLLDEGQTLTSCTLYTIISLLECCTGLFAVLSIWNAIFWTSTSFPNNAEFCCCCLRLVPKYRRHSQQHIRHFQTMECSNFLSLAYCPTIHHVVLSYTLL